jgi:hypothetical protein
MKFDSAIKQTPQTGYNSKNKYNSQTTAIIN